MLKIGITGQNGFIGSYLYNTLGLNPDKYKRIFFKKEFFESEELLDLFVSECDVIVHLAAMNRHENPEIIYHTNKNLAEQLVKSLERTHKNPYVLFSSSSQEELDNLYGKSKKEGRELIYDWAIKNNSSFSGLIIPNVFGPFGKPFYNSVVATFCYQLTHKKNPEIVKDDTIKLIYVGELVNQIIMLIDRNINNLNSTSIAENIKVPFSKEIKVSDILKKITMFKETYFDCDVIPELTDSFDLNLFNTFRSYIEHHSHYPVKYAEHKDNRGEFVEIIKLETGGQVSFSITKSDVTRGNHFHTRKIERFSVIKGEALIQLRKIDSSDVINFNLSGSAPSFVDMPIWYTHNIKNIGTEDLYTIFWINEIFDSNNSDTFFENV